MKLYKIMLWGAIGSAMGYGFVKLIWGEPLVFEDLFTRTFFLSVGILAGWYFKGKNEQAK